MSVDTEVIERTITIAATPETVFRLLTDPNEYVRWKGQRAEFDPRPDGMFRVIFPNGTDVVAGKFVELIPGERAGGGTRLHLVHRGLPVPAIARHAEGWDHFLPRLIAVGAGGAPASESAHHTAEPK